MDENNFVDRAVQGRQPGSGRIGPGLAAGRRAPARQAGEGGRRGFFAPGTHNDDHLARAGRQQRFEGPPGHGLAGQAPPLLGIPRAGAFTGTGGDEDGRKFHASVYP